MLIFILSGCITLLPAADRRSDRNKAEMERHWVEAEAGRDAVIAGDLAGAAACGKALAARLPLEGLPDGLQSKQLALEAAAGKSAAAQELEPAAQGVAETARACGACHASVGHPVKLGTAPAPSGRSKMAGHELGAARLWEGLVASDQAALEEAFRILQEDQLVPLGTPVDQPPPREAWELAVRVQDAAAEAAHPSSSWEQRTQAYASVLQTCASCHGLMGRGGSPDRARCGEP